MFNKSRDEMSTKKHIFVYFCPQPAWSQIWERFYPDVAQRNTCWDATPQTEFRSKRKRSKLTTLLAAHTRLGNLGKYPLPPGMTHPPAEVGTKSQITFTEILKTVFRPTTRKYPGYAPESKYCKYFINYQFVDTQRFF